MHRPHWSDRTVGRPVWPVRVGHTGYTRISDGVSRCGELFDLTDYGVCGVGGTTKSTTIFLSSVSGSLPAMRPCVASCLMWPPEQIKRPSQ